MRFRMFIAVILMLLAAVLFKPISDSLASRTDLDKELRIKSYEMQLIELEIEKSGILQMIDAEKHSEKYGEENDWNAEPAGYYEEVENYNPYSVIIE